MLNGYGLTCAQENPPDAARPSSTLPATAAMKKALPAAADGIEKLTPDEEAIRRNGAEFIKAYQTGDAKALSGHFAKDAECVDESGVCCSGAAAIENSMAEFFKANPGCKLIKTIDSIRFVSPGVAIEDGTTACTCADESSCVVCRYSTVHVKQDGKWLVASVHDRDSHDLKEHSMKLTELAWLQGEWVDEGDDAVIHFSCKPIDNGNFLMRSFSIQVSGEETMAGTQRIGWDPLSGKLRTWVFDSSGSFGEGVWYRNLDDGDAADSDDADEESNADDGDESEASARWILKMTGVMADGKPASSTSIYTLINDHTMTWQSVDHEIAGVHQPDSEVVTIVRKAEAPAPVTSGTNN